MVNTKNIVDTEKNHDDRHLSTVDTTKTPETEDHPGCKTNHYCLKPSHREDIGLLPILRVYRIVATQAVTDSR
jgi:hypothetical protein